MLMKEDQNYDIWIDKDGLYYIEEQKPHTRRGIQSLLQSQTQKNPQTVLHVNADKTSHHHIVFLLDITQQDWVFKS